MSLTPPARIALLSWVVCTISLPIFRWFWSDRGLRWSISVGVVAQAVAVVLILSAAWGWARTILTAFAILLLGWAVEYLGSHTGFPFGRYHYTNRLWPQLGHVPLLIPVAWLMMLPPAWAIGRAIGGGHSRRTRNGRPIRGGGGCCRRSTARDCGRRSRSCTGKNRLFIPARASKLIAERFGEEQS